MQCLGLLERSRHRPPGRDGARFLPRRWTYAAAVLGLAGLNAIAFLALPRNILEAAAPRRMVGRTDIDTVAALDIAADSMSMGVGNDDMEDVRARKLFELNPMDPMKQLEELKRQVDIMANQTLGIDVSNSSAASAFGVQTNARGDRAVIISAVLINGVLIVVELLAFSALRLAVPQIYSHYATAAAGDERTPETPEQTFFGWVRPSFSATSDPNLWKHVGLDEAMMLEFLEMCCKICIVIGVPMALVLCPVNYILGRAEPLDQLSAIGTANLEKSSWIFYLHAVVVWLVVLVVQHFIRQTFEDFAEKRFQWLIGLPHPRATTVMVRNIPMEYRSDARLKEIFVQAFSPEQIREAVMVKRTEELASLVAQSKAIVQERKYNEHKARKHKSRPLMLSQLGEQQVEIDVKVDAERERIRQEALEVGGVNTSGGFVTFSSQRDVAIAFSVRLTRHTDEFEISLPPDPDAVNYGELRDVSFEGLRNFIGYMIIILIFWVIVGIIVIIQQGADLIKNKAPIYLKPVLVAIVPSIGLTLVLSFVPTIFILIFKAFWVIPSEPEVQHKLYWWYFSFLLAFVLLVTMMGSSPLDLAEKVFDSPRHTPNLLAHTLPQSSNFYICYIILHTATHSLNMTRYVNVIKFVIHRHFYDSATAREQSEPEDQDYFGTGGRGARWANVMLIGLVFCQIQPLVILFASLDMFFCKVAYGYLVLYAETRKTDMGGIMFARQIRSLELGVLIYIMLMTGYLANRADWLCSTTALCSAFYLCFSVWKLEKIQWRHLPWIDVPRETQAASTPLAKRKGNARDFAASYEQPEFSYTSEQLGPYEAIPQDIPEVVNGAEKAEPLE